MNTTPLTPEAVASLTDAELSEAVARVVFGAEWYGDGWPHYHGDYPHAEARRCGCGKVWKSVTPFAKLSETRSGTVLLYTAESGLPLAVTPHSPQAYSAVLEHMRQRWAGRMWKWEIGEEETGEEDGVLVWCAVVRSREGWQVALAESPSFGRATFECALIAAQEMEKEG